MRPAVAIPVVLSALLLHATPARSQGLKDKITELFIFGPGQQPLFLAGTADPNNPLSVQAHGNHFIPSSSTQNGTVITFLTQAISTNIANSPSGATSGGETFRFEGGVPVMTSTSAGPILAERAQTLGQGRLLVGIGQNSFHFTSLRGVPLSNLPLVFTHQNVNFAGCDSAFGGDCSKMGVPNLENDVINVNLALDLKVAVTSVYATYGLFDRFDIGVVIPIVSTSLRGHSNAQVVPFGGPTATHFFAGTQANPVLSASRDVSGSAFGLGDVAVRAKLNVRESPRVSMSLLGDARFPTGDAEDMLGAGRFSARGLAVFSSRFDAFAPHANLGFIFHQGNTQNNGVLATAGFDDLIAEHVTLAADLVTQLQVGRSTLRIPPPVLYDVPFKRSVIPVPIPDIRDDIVNGSLGFKFVPTKGFTIVTNILFPLNQGGLRAGVTYTAGLEFTL